MCSIWGTCHNDKIRSKEMRNRSRLGGRYDGGNEIASSPGSSPGLKAAPRNDECFLDSCFRRNDEGKAGMTNNTYP